MEHVYSAIKNEIADAISAALAELNYKADGIENTIDFSKGFGDISSSISFRLAKEQKKSPDAVAKEIMSKSKKPDGVDKITVENGFINFHLDRAKFTRMVLEEKWTAQKPLGEKGDNRIPERQSKQAMARWPFEERAAGRFYIKHVHRARVCGRA